MFKDAVRGMLLFPDLTAGRCVSLAFAVFCALAVCVAVWPGFMSWDSLFAYQEMRNGITSSAYPPVMSYVWYLADLLVPGQGGVLILQNMLIFVSFSWISQAMGLGRAWSSMALAVMLLSPIILGPMLVIWKDIGMSASLISALAAMIAAAISKRPLLLLLSFVLLVVGASYRLNSLPAIAPLAIGLAVAWLQATKRTPTIVGAVSRALIVLMGVAIVSFLSISYRLPDFKRLNLGLNAGWTAVYDLLGISVCTGVNIVPDSFFLAPPSPADVKRIYRPEHIQLSFDMAQKKNPGLLQLKGLEISSQELPKLWSEAVQKYPICYLRHRAQLVKYVLGLNAGDVFYITHGGVDENKFGLTITSTPLTHRVVSYILESAKPGLSPNHLLARPWFFLLIATISLVFLALRRSPMLLIALILYSSAGLYLLGNAFVLPAADGRYQHWAVLCFFLMSVLAVAELRRCRFGFGAPTVSWTPMPEKIT